MTELEELKEELAAVQQRRDSLRTGFNGGRWNEATIEYKRLLLDQEHNMSEYIHTLNMRISLLANYTTPN